MRCLYEVPISLNASASFLKYMNQNTKKFRILITGSTGFIGIHLTKKLNELGHNLKLLVRETSDTTPFNDLKNIEYIIGDVQDIDSIYKALNNIDVIYHLAAYTGIWAKNKKIYHDINVKGTENITKAAIEKGKTLLYVSSFTALGPTPLEPVDETYEKETFCMMYEESKCQAKRLVKGLINDGLDALIFYPGIVYGPGDFNIFGEMLYDTVLGKTFPLGLCPGKGESIANFTYIKDLIDTMVRVIDNNNIRGDDFILGGENVKFVEYLNLIAQIARGKKAKKIPMWIAMAYAWLLELKAKFSKKLPKLPRPTLRAIKYHRSYSSQKAIEKLGYKITPLREGLEETIEWYKDFIEKEKK